MTTTAPVKLEVFVDYTCPWVRQAAIWLGRVRDLSNGGLDLNWRCFALEQVNSKQGAEWKAWEQEPDYVSRGLMPLRGGVAARRMGADAHWRYMMAVLEAKHTDLRDVRSREAILEVAAEAGLDMEQFTAHLDDPDTLAEVASDHEWAASQGIFGTPTIVFEDGSAAYLKMYTPPEGEELEVFKSLTGMARGRKYFGELKRPQPPWPRGALD